MLSVLFAFAVVAAGSANTPPADCRGLPAPPPNIVQINDNRVRAGTLRDNVLTVNLVARTAAWKPDGEASCALSVHAFSEAGKVARIPGPLLRVRAGTTVRVSIQNTLPSALWVRGLHNREMGQLDSAEVAAGATRVFEFVPTMPGAWFYSGGMANESAPVSNANGQLVGALVVDSANSAPPAPDRDRVFVITRWTPTGTRENDGFQLNAINGRSWPNTEQLSYTVGDSVRWHVINAGDGVHEMHLHGFYFRVDAKGFSIDSGSLAAPRAAGSMRVTVVLRPGEWVSMTWVPEREGNWLYHCHVLTHMSGAQHLSRMPTATSTAMQTPVAAMGNDHAHTEMGGLVMGIKVQPSRLAANKPAAIPVSTTKVRAIDLYANTRLKQFGEKPAYGFIVQEGAKAPASDSVRIPGSPLVLARGEPVRIAVHNQLGVPISVHWHGIELDSYNDGVGGFSGSGKQLAPMISPRDSFVVRFTPPRAGTFMYHVHGESGDELSSGLYAPLLVLEPGKTLDTVNERLFMIAEGAAGTGVPIVINGSTKPDTTEFVAGRTYRLRLFYISANEIFFTTLRGPNGPEVGKQVAVDGHDFPADKVVPRPMRFPFGPGHTVDYEFTPGVAGNYSLVVERFVYSTGFGVQTGPPVIVPMKVRTP